MLRSLSLFAVSAVVALAGSRPPRCDRLFVGGVVHGADGARPASIAVADGRIVALVPPDETGAWRAAAVQVVDLSGGHVYPGLTESHGHLVGYGAALEQVDLRGAGSLDEVVTRVAEAARRLPPGAWVLGRGWDQNLWAGSALPTHRTLSAAVPDRPALLRRVDGHAILVNARALAAAGITAESADPPGGRIVRDSRGAPTGVLIDAAAEAVERLVPAPTAADLERRIALAGRHLAAFGITEIHDAGTGRLELEVLRRMAAAGTLPVRVYVMLDGADDGLLAEEFANGPKVSVGGMLAVRAVKLYADGALGSRGAWLSAPYADEPGTRGLEVVPETRLAEVVSRAAKAQFQPCIHAIGDAAVSRVLDVFERAGVGALGLRPRVEHAQIVRPEDVSRFARLGAIAAVQPTHCTSDMPWVGARLGEARVPWAYRWRTLLAAGAHLSLGSDVPVESPDPRLGIWAALTRRPLGVTSAPPWNPAETLTGQEAVAGYTSWAARAAFEEDWRGALAPSFAADLTVVDRAIEVVDPAAVLQATVLRTVVAGHDAFVLGGQR